MNQSTKQRIVGTVVLLALALIFLPILFDGDGSYQRPLSSRIPETPQLQPMPRPVPQRPIIQADRAAAVTNEPVTSSLTAESANASPSTPRTIVDTEEPTPIPIEAVQESPALEESGVPVGWSVRLGTFSNASNARNLSQRLLNDGYKVYSRDIKADSGALTAVYVGPQVDRGRAEELKQQLQLEFQLSGIVERYVVDSL